MQYVFSNLLSGWPNLKYFCSGISLIENIKILGVECPISLVSVRGGWDPPSSASGKGMFSEQCWGAVISESELYIEIDNLQSLLFQMKTSFVLWPHHSYLTAIFSRCFLLSPQTLQISPACLLIIYWYLPLSAVQFFSCKFMEVHTVYFLFSDILLQSLFAPAGIITKIAGVTMQLLIIWSFLMSHPLYFLSKYFDSCEEGSTV